MDSEGRGNVMEFLIIAIVVGLAVVFSAGLSAFTRSTSQADLMTRVAAFGNFQGRRIEDIYEALGPYQIATQNANGAFVYTWFQEGATGHYTISIMALENVCLGIADEQRAV